MARKHDKTTPTESTAPRDPRRRSLITLGIPAAGGLGLAAGLLPGQRATAGATPGESAARDADASEMTPHRGAYYRRARF